MRCHQHCASRDVVASRRAFIAGIACTALVPSAALAQLSGPGSDVDVQFMRMAIEEARQGDFPFGAVMVRDGAGIAPRAQPRTHHQRSDRAWRDGRDPAVPGRARPRRVARQHALHVGQILRDVHGRDHLVSHGAAGLRTSIAQLATKIDQIMLTDTEISAKAPVRPDRDHRRRARGRGAGPVYEVTATSLFRD